MFANKVYIFDYSLLKKLIRFEIHNLYLVLFLYIYIYIFIYLFPGLTDRRADMGSIREQIFNVTNLFLPKGHDYIDFDYDIALLQLDGQALLNDYVRTICLPPEPINGDNLGEFR